MTSVSTPHFVVKPLILALSLASFHALAAGPEGLPNAGSLLQQIQLTLPTQPQTSTPAIQVRPKADASLPPSQPVPIKLLRIVDNTSFATEVLHALVADQEGKSLTLPELDEVARRITTYYQNQGFPLTRAIIPAQSIRDGVVVIQVIEARFDKVSLNNQSKVNDSLLNATLAPLSKGKIITDDELNRSLLLLSDVPGVGVGAVIKPGSEVGTTDVDVTANHVQAQFANLSLDNYGNRYVGRERLSGNLNFYNPLRHGDIFSVSVMTTGSGMNYGRLAYDTLINGQGTRVGAAYSALRYKLGDSISALDANGTASVASAWIKQPLVRSKQFNLYTQLQYDAKRLRDRIDTTNLRTDRHLDNWILSFNSDFRDNLLGGGMSIASLGVTSGRVAFDDAAAAASDAATARTKGSYSKLNANFTRLQGLTSKDSLYINVNAQWAGDNLDSAEKMSAGGPYSVRAYDIGAISGDSGYFGSVEWRHDLGSMLAGQWQVTAFFDTAHVKVNHQPWNNGENSANLSGAGFGLNWIGPDQWRASASVATRVGSTPALVSAQASVRGWLAISKGF